MVQGYLGNLLTAHFFGAEEFALNAISNTPVSYLWNIATALNGVAVGLILFVCGLSIAYKIYLKRQPDGTQNSELLDKC